MLRPNLPGRKLQFPAAASLSPKRTSIDRFVARGFNRHINLSYAEGASASEVTAEHATQIPPNPPTSSLL